MIGVALSGSNKVKVLKDKKLSTEIKFQAAPLALDFYRHNDKDFMVVGGVEGTIYVVKLKWAWFIIIFYAYIRINNKNGIVCYTNLILRLHQFTNIKYF